MSDNIIFHYKLRNLLNSFHTCLKSFHEAQYSSVDRGRLQLNPY